MFSSNSKQITVNSSSRIHFGLVAIGNVTDRSYGGLGVMVKNPGVSVSCSSNHGSGLNIGSLSNSNTNESLAAVELAARRWFDRIADRRLVGDDFDALDINLKIGAVGRHCGLGSGTQLAFATATALQTFVGLPMPSVSDLAIALDRGKRSAIGCYGFFQGGLLVDGGIGSQQRVADLDFRGDFPDDWPILLVSPTFEAVKKSEEQVASGIVSGQVSGQRELDAFASLPPTTQLEADEMSGIIKKQIVPALIERNFQTFATSVTEYGRRSGLYYATSQGGVYASQFSKRVVDTVLDLGNYGVSQSSWGPTIFVIAPSNERADKIQAHLLANIEGCQIVRTFANNHGVEVKTMASHQSAETPGSV